MAGADLAANSWSEIAHGTNSGATASKTAVAGKTFVVTWFAGHTDADATVQILGGAAGATVLCQVALDVSAQGFTFGMPGLCLVGETGVKMEAKISASSSDCSVSFGGYYIP
jgi:hypothetical protein